MNYDIVIKNGKIIDGTGNPWYYGDVGIKDGQIIKIKPINASTITSETRTIDASNLNVCPGFIDIHSHADHNLFVDNELECLIRQGITTVVVGNCGGTLAPLAPLTPEQKEYFMNIIAFKLKKDKLTDLPWYTFKQYLKLVENIKCTANIIHLVGFKTIRSSVLQMDDRTPTSAELDRMKDLVEEAMQAGAFGFSTGLIYAPQMYASTEEIIELAKIAGKYKGLYFSHMRNEGTHQFEALNEFFEIVEKSGVLAGQISHHKISGEKNWGMSKETLKMIEAANKRGLCVRLDQYPYTRGANSLGATLPGWARVGGREKIQERLRNPEIRAKIKEELKANQTKWENLFISSMPSEKWKDTEGLNLTEITEKKKYEDPFDLFATLLLEVDDEIGKISKYGSEEDVKRIMQSDYMMVGTDASSAKFGEGVPHPRFYGTYPRILGKYVREEKVLRLEEAIRKMTSFPAQTLGLQDRGLVREGMWADLVIFDEDRVIDKATYEKPHQYPEGIDYVMVNGKIVVDQAQFTGELAGHLLKRPW